ncbi:hypothetical protein DdX_03273 [Ditylenchus destructor]|uniref:Uncharacterized protein n=1 Tax=Ditylenchus destructor TaxID=166010 RepID=A0AAD4NHN3_9BILA|nr:hypothetical protein DdX_03273 [Ditylenchus destructor]
MSKKYSGQYQMTSLKGNRPTKREIVTQITFLYDDGDSDKMPQPNQSNVVESLLAWKQFGPAVCVGLAFRACVHHFAEGVLLFFKVWGINPTQSLVIPLTSFYLVLMNGEMGEVHHRHKRRRRAAPDPGEVPLRRPY